MTKGRATASSWQSVACQGRQTWPGGWEGTGKWRSIWEGKQRGQGFVEGKKTSSRSRQKASGLTSIVRRNKNHSKRGYSDGSSATPQTTSDAVVRCLRFIPRISGKRGRVLCKGKICSNVLFLFLKGNSGKFVKCEPKGAKWRVRQRERWVRPQQCVGKEGSGRG